MHTNFSNPQKAGIFTVVVLVLAVAAALVIDGFGLGANLFVWASVWSITPVLATLIMLLVVTRDGYSKEGWRTLGLHRLGLRFWWIAFFGSLAITVVAYAVVWLTPLASVTVPPQGVLPVVGLLSPAGADTGDHVPAGVRRSGSGDTCCLSCFPWDANGPCCSPVWSSPPGTCRWRFF